MLQQLCGSGFTGPGEAVDARLAVHMVDHRSSGIDQDEPPPLLSQLGGVDLEKGSQFTGQQIKPDIADRFRLVREFGKPFLDHALLVVPPSQMQVHGTAGLRGQAVVAIGNLIKNEPLVVIDHNSVPESAQFPMQGGIMGMHALVEIDAWRPHDGQSPDHVLFADDHVKPRQCGATGEKRFGVEFPRSDFNYYVKNHCLIRKTVIEPASERQADPTAASNGKLCPLNPKNPSCRPAGS